MRLVRPVVGKLGARDMGMCSACAGASARACAKQHVEPGAKRGRSGGKGRSAGEGCYNCCCEAMATMHARGLTRVRSSTPTWALLLMEPAWGKSFHS